MANEHNDKTDMDYGTPQADADFGELDQILDTAQLAWERGDTLQKWLDRYPLFALELGELALSLERQQRDLVHIEEESTTAGKAFLQAMDTIFRPTKVSEQAT